MTNIVRAFVIALTLTGTTASLHSTQTAHVQVSTTKANFFPIPMCPPSDPNGCGIGKW